jgi:hypothetical protein
MAGMKYEELCEKNDSELEAIFLAAKTPDKKNLLGWEFRGFNIPAITKLIGIQKFKKGFFLAPGQNADGPEAMGFNVQVIQNGLHGKWLAKPTESNPRRFGFYRVYQVKPEEKDNKYPHALLLNYGMSRNGMDPARLLRDYLVQPDPANPDIYLGRAFFAIGPLRVFPSFFVLERHNEIEGEIGY